MLFAQGVGLLQETVELLVLTGDRGVAQIGDDGGDDSGE